MLTDNELQQAFSRKDERNFVTRREDAPSGVAAAKAAGMQCVVVLNTHIKKELEGGQLL